MSKIDGWVTSALPDLLRQMKSGGTPDTSRSDFYGGDIPFVSIEDMTSCGKSLKKTKKKITDAGLQNSNCWLVSEDSILYSIYATIGIPRINLIPVTTNQAILALQYKEGKIDNEYLFYWLESIRPLILNLASQTTQSNLNATTVKGFVVRHPVALQEQSKIAEILSTVDQAIEQTEALIAKQKRIKTGLMQDLLTRGIDEHGQLRTEATQAFKYSPLGRIPVEWSVEFIENLLADVDPAMRSGPFGSALLKEELTEIGVPLLGIDNVHTELFVDKFIRFVDPGKAEALKRYFVRAHDIMITIMGTVGRCCVVPNDIGPALSSKHTWTISLDPNKYRPYLACIQINHAPWVLAHFAKDEQGGIMSSIKSDTLRATLLPVPPLGEALEIEARLSAMDADLALKRVLLNKLKYQKIALMQDLLTGHKRVTALLEPTAA
jgi:type I restriction enzyme S subunit